MKNIKSSIKLFWPHMVILLLLLAGIIISLVSFANIGNQAQALFDESLTVKNAGDSANKAFETMQICVFRAISNDTNDISDEVLTDAGNAFGTIQEQAALIKQSALGDTDSISRLEKSLNELAPMQEHVLSLISQGRNDEAAEYMESRNIPVIKEAQMELTQLIQSAGEKESELLVSFRQTQRNTILLLISLGAVGVLFSVGVGIYISQRQKKGDDRIDPVQIS